MISFFKHRPYNPNPEDEKISCLQGFGTAGEMVSLSFSLAAHAPIEELRLSSSDLRNSTSLIPKSCVSMFIVKAWQQAGLGIYQSAPVQVAELLLKDDRASLRDGYTRRGNCQHWKHLVRASQIYKPPHVRLQGDAVTRLDGHERKQVWVAVTIPPEAAPGLYHGCVELNPTNPQLAAIRLDLRLNVLPFDLLPSEPDLFLWYKGTLDCNWPQHYVSEKVFRAQLQDIYDHGFRSISLNEYEPARLQVALNIAHAVGFNRNVVLTAPYPERFANINFRSLNPIYYISDEVDRGDAALMRDHIEKWNRVKAAGGQTMSSLVRQGNASRFLDDNGTDCAPEILSYYLPANLAYFHAQPQLPAPSTSRVYYHWQSHMEKPLVHRVLAGLYLWQSNANGIAPYCYQHLPQPPFSPFNDFDEWEPGFHTGESRHPFKDHMTTYPARLGSIPTLQWKGLADGIYDLRYLSTLQSALKETENSGTKEVQLFREAAQLRIDTFLERISLNKINITSDTDPDPYPEIMPDEYANFREQVARDLITLTSLVGNHIAE
jgi:hypothetical protein